MPGKRIALSSQVEGLASSATLAFLMVIAGRANESETIATLRGESWVEAELNRAESPGYYEKLVNMPQGGGPRPGGGATAPPPPPGFLTFDEAGLVENVPGYLRWRLRPNVDTVWNGAHFRTNRLGFRTPEFLPDKPEGTYRVVVFGALNTMGHGVSDDEVYVRRLEVWLNGQVGPGRRVEVVNLAIPGESPSRRLLRLQELAGRFGADWLLCDATVFDSLLEETHLHTAARPANPDPVRLRPRSGRTVGRRACRPARGLSAQTECRTGATPRRRLRRLECRGEATRPPAGGRGPAEHRPQIAEPATVRADRGARPAARARTPGPLGRVPLRRRGTDPRLALGPAPERPRPPGDLRGAESRPHRQGRAAGAAAPLGLTPGRADAESGEIYPQSNAE